MKESHRRFFEISSIVITFALIAALAFVGHGCARAERAGYAADLKAGVQAARDALKKPELSPIVDMILAGVEVRIPAVAGVNSSEIPAPTISPTEIQANPQHYIDTAPPEPSTPWGKIVGVAIAGFITAYPFIKRLPYVGDAITIIHDVIYPFLVSPKAAAADREAHELLKQASRPTEKQG